MSLFFAATLAVFGGAGDAYAQSCGNGNVQDSQGEACDDGDTDNGDGCSSTCTIEPGWDCVGNPSVCNLIVCGNDITQAGEECDGGGCCNTDCTLKDNGTSCRAAAGDCDAAETCDGSSADCPVDAKLTSECRASAGACDLAETCDGSSNDCPTDIKSTSECRASAGSCDVAETCDGSSNDCPANAFLSSATECRASGGVCDIAENCTGSSAACPADAKSTSECRAANGVCDLAESCNGSSNDCPVDAKASSETVCRPAVNEECDAVENCTGVTDNCPDDVLIGCGDGDGVDCTVSACTVDGCVEEETCVEICRGPGFWQNHSGYEKDGENIGQAVIDAVGSLSICGVSIDATTSLGSLNSALEGLCMRAQGVKQRQLYRQLVTAALNCSVSEGGTCDQITNRFTDIGFDDCSDLCAGAELPDGPTVKECTDAMACFNAGGRIIEGECAKGTCDGDGETYCGNDEDCGDTVECVRFEDSCRGVDLCSEDLEAPAQICPTSGPASSPKLCQEARHNGCTIDSCY